MHPVPLGESGGSKGQGQGGRRGITRPAQAKRGRLGIPAELAPQARTLDRREGGPLRAVLAVCPRADGSEATAAGGAVWPVAWSRRHGPKAGADHTGRAQAVPAGCLPLREG